MPDRSQLARIGGRAGRGVLGLVGIAVVVATLGAATLVTLPTLERDPQSSEIKPLPSEQQRVCPGPLLTLAEDSTQAQAASSVGAASAVYGAVDARSFEQIRPQVTEITAVDDSNSRQPPLLLTVPVQNGASLPPLVAGSQSQVAATDTIGGLAVAACAEAVSDSWIVGGSTDIGRTSLLLLSNPTTVLATVDVTVSGESGLVDAPGSTGILVQPGEQRVISLAGLAPNVKSPVLHVQSRGGQVAASLEQSSIRGIEPGGVEIIGTTATPATNQIIAGVRVMAAVSEETVTTGEGFNADTPSIRVFVPGSVAATVQIGVTSDDGTVEGTSTQVEVEPGIATEIPLAPLAVGSFSVQLRSDEPIVAAARTAVDSAGGKDFGWFSASAPLEGSFAVAVADGPSPTLHLVNSGAADASLTLTPSAGTPVDLEVGAGASATVPLANGVVYAVSGGSQLWALVDYSGDGVLSSFALNPPGPLASSIRVYTH
ncbi:hypothetical protein E3O06_07245 [Cryobacterium glaciale]|uniref:Large extracellular alpha-helical protein n=1 Tax=Cryobacterium glaciale TaxID=1259145 RepID=A0A4R8UXG3_9MICO|nr:DUF5719 family protein [Cryobacterium glaciale]TFB74193.1 hypothetical protein E3O06_07245 [Cryobacterium glaciale]